MQAPCTCMLLPSMDCLHASVLPPMHPPTNPASHACSMHACMQTHSHCSCSSSSSPAVTSNRTAARHSADATRSGAVGDAAAARAAEAAVSTSSSALRAAVEVCRLGWAGWWGSRQQVDWRLRSDMQHPACSIQHTACSMHKPTATKSNPKQKQRTLDLLPRGRHATLRLPHLPPQPLVRRSLGLEGLQQASRRPLQLLHLLGSCPFLELEGGAPVV